MRKPAGIAGRRSPITTADYPTPAARPANSRLDTAKLQHAFGITPDDWQADLAACLEDVGDGPTYGSS